jgi:DNA polymerase III alpha subunit
MIGSQKSSRIDSLKDQYGRVVYNRHDLYEMLYNQENIESIESVEWHEDFEKYNTAIQSNYLNINTIKPIEIITTELAEFDKNNQSRWFLPDEYKTIDVTDYVKKLCYTEQELIRVDEELTEFSKRDMIMLLRYMIYLVDYMRENKIVWGVGRGSSVASYVLYLIGIHKINSIHYDLDWKEFLR